MFRSLSTNGFSVFSHILFQLAQFSPLLLFHCTFASLEEILPNISKGLSHGNSRALGAIMQRQDSLLSSSHRQTPPPENHHARPIGCLSSIIKLFSKNQNRNKRLTFGRKYEKGAVPNSANAKALVEEEQKDSSSVLKEENKNLDKIDQNLDKIETKRLTCDITTPRSPMLPSEIRRPNALSSSDSTTTPPGLVARLMGLEERHKQQRQHPNTNGNKMEEEELSTEEKRKKLLQALEKCNEDLESLKKIVMAVQSGEKRFQSPLPAAVQYKLKEESLAKICMKRNVEHLMRPASALEELNRCCQPTKSNSNGIVPHQSMRILGKKPGEDDSISIRFFNKVAIESFMKKHKGTTPTFWGSKAMIQSVDEVCNDIIWGEKRELGNIGLMLQNYICRELIEEVVIELGFCKMHPLPFESCKRRLSF